MKAECGQAHPQNALHSMSRNWVLNNDNMVPARNKTDTLEEHPLKTFLSHMLSDPKTNTTCRSLPLLLSFSSGLLLDRVLLPPKMTQDVRKTIMNVKKIFLLHSLPSLFTCICNELLMKTRNPCNSLPWFAKLSN